MRSARTAPQIALRVTQELKDWLAHKAIDNHRSLNAEITVRLEESRTREGGGELCHGEKADGQ
ncbi:Arc family DNA-binding protein [Propionivibrio limicola]|uniref:Arc family DNA-binding protein n=1 Tax=Propionivibrio limicola TaxID=167645 RepID=UPI001290F44C|nr:Arc family DNA-binding protein [Propionivibrio limicola]